jgi:4-diphosphocytidyl-2-C-methyl-D-erythritol kinase
MKWTERKAFAKINLSLNIFPERGPRGYYKVLFVNTSVSLHDLVKIAKTRTPGIRIDEPIVEESENIARSAALLMFETFDLGGGLDISIIKRIPSRAGLGGGSSDAAAVINGIIELYGLSLSIEERIRFASRLGMDVCYCIVGGLCTVEGIGDVVKRLPWGPPPLNLLLASPEEKKPSTAWAYSILEEGKLGRKCAQFEALLDGLRESNTRSIAENLYNDFERFVFNHYGVAAALKRRMLELGAISSILAGSGLSVFGVFEEPHILELARMALQREGFWCQAAHPVE